MQVYRADDADAARLVKTFADLRIPAQIERYGRDATYVVVESNRPDLPILAKSAGRSVKRVFTVEQLAASAAR